LQKISFKNSFMWKFGKGWKKDSRQGKVDKKSSPPKVQLKNGTTFLYGNKKVDSKYFEVKI
jgi:hypothetical protein